MPESPANRRDPRARDSIKPDWPMPVLQNVVATVNLDCRIDLKVLADQARNVEYNRKKFHALVMRIRDPKTTTLIFASGKMVVTGAKSEEAARLAARKHARIVQKCGFNTKFRDFKVQNFVGSSALGFHIRLEGVSAHYYTFCHYEPEIFPGLIYRIVKPRVVCLVFANGKLVLTGAKVLEDLNEAFNCLYPILLDYKIE
ncbi:hypothetical protein B0H67DRAFT_490156 [Lasiosphaeris hirsuta]|uniref:TATA-box-binding protein n=1 Tax=Lasiosphaeris hirsuta TaxID=260670 RepID=A0AA40DTR1_9PEZI|nr:hypothetical protein B0H67DRAFT_490156 [Lasiosphaeris hirsuta]